MSFKAGSSAISLLWSTFDQSKSPDEIGFNLIKSNRDSNMAGDCHNLLTLLKRVRGSRRNPPTIWKGSKQIKKINRPAISSFAEADLSLTARLLSKFKQIRFNLFPYLQGDDYTLALLINSPPGVQGKRTSTSKDFYTRQAQEDSTSKDFFKRTPQAEDSSRRTVRSWIQRLLENYFSIQGANTLTPSSQGISGTRREGIPNWRRFWEVARGFYQPSILWFPEPSEKGISSLASSKGQSGRALTRLLSAHFSRISEEIYL